MNQEKDQRFKLLDLGSFEFGPKVYLTIEIESLRNK